METNSLVQQRFDNGKQSCMTVMSCVEIIGGRGLIATFFSDPSESLNKLYYESVLCTITKIQKFGHI